jgi:hypothetical protein
MWEVTVNKQIGFLTFWARSGLSLCAAVGCVTVGG